MLNPRVPLRGLLAALLALMVQLALGATVPNAQAALSIAAAPICHSDDGTGNAPAPAHVPDCLVCPLCAAVHASAAIVLPPVSDAVPFARLCLLPRPELPPPATAPPSVDWPPNQPRAPPAFS